MKGASGFTVHPLLLESLEESCPNAGVSNVRFLVFVSGTMHVATRTRSREPGGKGGIYITIGAVGALLAVLRLLTGG